MAAVVALKQRHQSSLQRQHNIPTLLTSSLSKRSGNTQQQQQEHATMALSGGDDHPKKSKVLLLLLLCAPLLLVFEETFQFSKVLATVTTKERYSSFQTTHNNEEEESNKNKTTTDWKQFTLDHPKQAVELLKNLSNYEQINEGVNEEADEMHPSATATIPEIAASLESMEAILEKHPNATTIREIAVSLASVEGYPWNDIDYVQGIGFSVCGVRKCMWHSLSSSKNNSFAYLMTRKSGGKYYVSGKVYIHEKYLSHNYGFPLLSLEAPQLHSNVSVAMQTILHAYGHFPHHDDKEPIPLYIQRVALIPQPTLFIGETEWKSTRMKQAIPAFAKVLHQNNDNNTTSLQEFSTRFQEGVQQVVHFLRNEPIDDRAWQILDDFQVQVHSSGTWYHIDLDRLKKKKKWDGNLSTTKIKKPNLNHKTPYGDKTVQELIDNFEQRTERILYWLREGYKSNYKGLEEEHFCVSGMRCDFRA